MTNSERIAAANTRLSALVETAESLPDAGSVGGGVETCTVTITTKSLGAVKEVYASQYVDGRIVQYSIPGISYVTNLTIENIICGTVIVFSTSSPMMPGHSVTHDASYIKHQFGRWEFTAPTTAGVSCTIEVRDDDA